MPYPPIADHGIIGNMHTAALVAMDGTIDWLCLPRFDSPSVFGGLLDDSKGGKFRLEPAWEEFTRKQYYWPSTNVLITHFSAAEGTAEITDFMPMGGERDACRLIRRVESVRGTVPFQMECQPAFNYGRDAHKLELKGSSATFKSKSLSLALTSTARLRKVGNSVAAQFTPE